MRGRLHSTPIRDVLGSFNAYATRFVDDAYGFALSWNYWFNDAVSVASDLTAAQLVIAYWVDHDVWVVSVVFLIFLLGINAFSVGAYGEMGVSCSDVSMLHQINRSFRILVIFSQSHYYCGFRHCGRSGQCRRQYLPSFHWYLQLANSRCTLCGRIWGVCQGVRYRKLRM